MGLSLGALVAAAVAGHPVPDFELRGTTGVPVRLVANPPRPTVVVFFGTDCPLANLYAPRLKELAGRFPPDAVRVLVIDPNEHDTPAALAAFVRDHALSFPVLKDVDGRVAALFGATRTPEAFVLDAARRVCYRGRIDDQYAVGSRRSAPTREDLAEAVAEVLAGKPVAVPRTDSVGCVISRPRPAPTPPAVTYARDVAPILTRHCLPCHRPGEIGPFPLTSFAAARDHAGTIAEVVGAGTMPPWHAAPGIGRFSNDRRLSADQKRVIADWVRLGCPEGGPTAPVNDPPLTTGWAIGTPDAVFPIPAAFNVPAEGVVEYQNFIVDPGFTEDVWVRAAEVRPGDRRVVHHCNIFLSPPGAGSNDDIHQTGELGSANLIAFTPGSGPVRLPDGLAKRIPAGWRLQFNIHYTPIGTPQSDRTEVGLLFLPAEKVRKEVATRLLQDLELEIPPHAANHRVDHAWTADRDYLLLSMFAHMHLRGKSFRYTAEYPDGSTEVLLDIPAYDFNWQHRYVLEEPKRLPAGTVLRCTAVYDNSAGNPANPDPSATVRSGLQTWEEMFNGYYDIVLADQDMPAERAAAQTQRVGSQAVLLAASGLAVLWGWRMTRGRGRPSPPGGPASVVTGPPS